MNDMLMYLGKLLLGTVLMALVFGWLMPFLGMNGEMMGQAMFMTLLVWGLWTLRKMAGGSGGQ